MVEAYQLDDQDRPVTVTNVENQTMTIDYTVGNFVDKITRFDGTATVSNSYDSRGNLSSVTYPDSTLNMTYYLNDLLKSISDGGSSISNQYINHRLTVTDQIDIVGRSQIKPV